MLAKVTQPIANLGETKLNASNVTKLIANLGETQLVSNKSYPLLNYENDLKHLINLLSFNLGAPTQLRSKAGQQQTSS